MIIPLEYLLSFWMDFVTPRSPGAKELAQEIDHKESIYFRAGQVYLSSAR